MSAADEIGAFFDQVWKDTEGVAYLPVKSVDRLRKFMIPWPAKREEIITHVLKYAADPTSEVFFSPALYRSRKPIQSEVLGSWVAWADFDGNFPETWPKDIAPLPTIEVQSSSNGKRHVYWELKEFTPPKKLQDINRSLAYALGADLSGWDANQFLRPPHTMNRKYDKPVEAKVVKNRIDRTYEHGAFDSVPTPKEAIRANVEVGELPDLTEVLAEATWDEELLELFRTSGDEMAHEGRDRSGALQRLAYEGAEHGWTDEQILVVLYDADDRWGKYTNRSTAQRERILLDLVNRARAKVGYNPLSELEQLSKALLTIDEVQDDTSDRVIWGLSELAGLKGINDWFVEGLLTPRGLGLFTGRPGVGKTQAVFQLAADLASDRSDFLGHPLRQGLTVLILSLEMNQYQLAHIAQPLSERYPDIHEERMPIYAKGERLALDQPAGQAYFEALMKKFTPDIVFIDSLSHMVAAELTSDSDMKVAFEFLQKARNAFDFALVIVHHHRKKANDAQSKKRANDLSDVYGSFYIAAAVDFVLDLEDRPEDAETKEITLSRLKSRYSELGDPVKIKRNDKLHFSVTSINPKLFEQPDMDEEENLGI